MQPERSVVSSLKKALLRAATHLRDGLRRDSYRPEMHYMRGPGPKTKARRAQNAKAAK